MSKQISNQQANFPLPSSGNEPSASSNSPHILFVGDLSFFCNEDHLYKLFSTFGRVVHVEIKRGKATGDSLLHGLVEMDSPLSVDQALTNLSGTKFMGRKLKISLTAFENPSTESDHDRANWVQVHVSFVTRQLEKLISEETLDHVFSSFGEVADVIVKRHKVSKDPRSQNGYGFVYYIDPAVATNAIYLMKHANIDGVTYDCSLSYRSEERLNLQKNQTSGPKSEVQTSSPLMSIPQHSSYYPTPAPPAPVAVAVYPQYSTATNPYNPPHPHSTTTQSSSSSTSFSRNPPTAVSNTLHQHHTHNLHTHSHHAPPPTHGPAHTHAPSHSNPPPQHVYLSHRQMSEQYQRSYDGRAAPPPPPPPPFSQSSSPQLTMQHLSHHHYNVGLLGFPQSPLIPTSHAPPPPPPPVQMTTPPQYDFAGFGFSPQQSFSPHHQYTLYGGIPSVPPSPYDAYSNLGARPSPPTHSVHQIQMMETLTTVPEIVRYHRGDSRNVRRQRQGNLRRMEDYQPTISSSISRSDSRDFAPTYRSGSSGGTAAVGSSGEMINSANTHTASSNTTINANHGHHNNGNHGNNHSNNSIHRTNSQNHEELGNHDKK